MGLKEIIKQKALPVLPPYLQGLFHAVNTYRIDQKLAVERAQRNNSRIKTLMVANSPIQLELGAFEPRAGWLTVDLLEEADLLLDLTKPLPLPDQSVDKVYSSHVFEHFFYKDIVKLLEECYRVLKSEGTFSICVPNASIYLNAYFHPEHFERDKYCVYKPAFHYNSKIDYVNYMAYMDGLHRYMWDNENLVAVLKRAGFSKVETRSFDPILDKKERDHESIYAIAVK